MFICWSSAKEIIHKIFPSTWSWVKHLSTVTSLLCRQVKPEQMCACLMFSLRMCICCICILISMKLEILAFPTQRNGALLTLTGPKSPPPPEKEKLVDYRSTPISVLRNQKLQCSFFLWTVIYGQSYWIVSCELKFPLITTPTPPIFYSSMKI